MCSAWHSPLRIFIVSRIKLLLSEVSQTTDLRKGIVQLPLHTLYLLFKPSFRLKLLGSVLGILPFRLQNGHSLFMGSHLLGDGQQLLKDGLSLLTARHGDMIDVLQYGSEIAAGVEQAAAHGKNTSSVSRAAISITLFSMARS